MVRTAHLCAPPRLASAQSSLSGCPLHGSVPSIVVRFYGWTSPSSGISAVLLSHEFDMPPELSKACATASLALPDKQDLEMIVREVAHEWTRKNRGIRVKTDARSISMLVNNLSGLTAKDGRHLMRNAVFNDGAT